MKRLKNILCLCAFALPLLGLSGCSGSSSTDEPTTSLAVVLTPNRTSITANGADQVIFTVKYNGMDVSSRPNMKITVTTPSGEQSEISGNAFSTQTQGEYTFTATFESQTSAPVTVTATAPVAEKYFRRVCFMDVTSTYCTFCPTASRAIAMLQQNRPDRIIALAFHADMSGGSDPFKTPATALLETLFPGTTSNLPAVIVDLRDTPESNNVSVAGAQAYNNSRNSYPATCGIRIESQYDESAGSLNITVGVTSNAGGEYRVAVVAVENGLVAPQKDGGLTIDDYVHNDVVRSLLTKSLAGDDLGVLEVDVEKTWTGSLTIDPAWNVDNMNIVAYVTDASGYINNVSECEAKNGMCDYKLNEE